MTNLIEEGDLQLIWDEPIAEIGYAVVSAPELEAADTFELQPHEESMEITEIVETLTPIDYTEQLDIIAYNSFATVLLLMVLVGVVVTDLFFGKGKGE